MSESHLQYELCIVLGHRHFLNLLFYQILLLRLHLATHVNNLVIHPKKTTFAEFKADISCNFTSV